MNSATETTVKDRLLVELQEYSDSRGRINIGFENLSKRLGLSGHDLTKNLEQLSKEGLVSLAWKADRIVRFNLRRGSLNEKILKEKRPAHKTKDRVIEWLIRQPVGLGGWVDTNPGAIRSALSGYENHNVNAVPVAVSQLTHEGRIETRKVGKRIVSIRLAPRPIVKPPASAPTTAGAVPEVPREVPPTPNLNTYIAARRIAHLAPESNPYITVVFEENPIAEEAILLLKALKGETDV